MYVERVPNRNSPPAILLRESYRDGDKVKKRTLANLSHWPAAKIEALRRVLRDEAVSAPDGGLVMRRSLPHGHVAAALGSLRRLGLDRVLAGGRRQPPRTVALCVAMIVARLIDPASKLATARQLDETTASSSLGAALALGAVDEQELYGALDWLLAEQPRIEQALARRHLSDGTLVLYDVSSTYFEGRTCELAAFGYSRDSKPHRPQIVFGLLCTAEGCPVAVEVFAGNTGDPATLKSQIDKLKRRFRLARVVLVGDRGMITAARIEQELKPAGLDWITALRAPQIQALAAADGPLQLSLFDERDLAEISSPDFPGERLVVCRNPALAAERTRKRDELLAATEADLARIKSAVERRRNPLRGANAIGLRVGAVLGRRKVAKHFRLTITDTGFAFERDAAAIAAEAALDGIYVLRTSLGPEPHDPAAIVKAYKQLANVERAFRSHKTVDLEIRPIHHRRGARVRAHVFLCMLAYHLEWHMRQALKPILFDDHDKAAADAARTSIVAPAQRSKAARAKAASKRTDDGLPVHGFRSLLAELATLTRNTMAMAEQPDATFLLYPQLTPVQARAFELLNVAPRL
jgi:Transposase DDE domain